MQSNMIWLLSCIAQCTATIIAIIGGFISSKLIDQSNERKNMELKIKKFDAELKYSEAKLASIDCLCFIRDHFKQFYTETKLSEMLEKNSFYKHNPKLFKEFWDEAVNILNELKNGNKQISFTYYNKLSESHYNDYLDVMIYFKIKCKELIEDGMEKRLATQNDAAYNIDFSQETLLDFVQVAKEQELSIFEYNKACDRVDYYKKHRFSKTSKIVFVGFAILSLLLPLIIIAVIDAISIKYFPIIKIVIIGSFVVGCFLSCFFISRDIIGIKKMQEETRTSKNKKQKSA